MDMKWNCCNCKCWDKEGVSLETENGQELPKFEQHHRCKQALQSIREGNDGELTNLKSPLVVVDGEDYSAKLFTLPYFGCIGWQTKRKSRAKLKSGKKH